MKIQLRQEKSIQPFLRVRRKYLIRVIFSPFTTAPGLRFDAACLRITFKNQLALSMHRRILAKYADRRSLYGSDFVIADGYITSKTT